MEYPKNLNASSRYLFDEETPERQDVLTKEFNSGKWAEIRSINFFGSPYHHTWAGLEIFQDSLGNWQTGKYIPLTNVPPKF